MVDTPLNIFFFVVKVLIGLSMVSASIVGLVISLKLQKLDPSRVAIRQMRSMTTPTEFKQLSRGEGWAPWVYSAEDWAAWAKMGWEDEEKRAKSPWLWLILPCCTGLFGLVMGLAFGEVWVGAVWVVGPIAFALGLPLAWLIRAWPRIKYRRILRCPPEVYLGSSGMYFQGKFYPWLAEFWALKDVVLVEGPLRGLRVIMERSSYSRAWTNRGTIVILLPVPTG